MTNIHLLESFNNIRIPVSLFPDFIFILKLGKKDIPKRIYLQMPLIVPCIIFDPVFTTLMKSFVMKEFKEGEMKENDEVDFMFDKRFWKRSYR